MRVLQIIDSLSIGGAERVAINYANALSENNGIKSYLCTTREGGMLEEFIKPEVEVLHLNKKGIFDYRAYRRLIQYVKQHNISILHAHSSSFFTAVVIKFFTKTKIVWHDHYGHSEKINERPVVALKVASRFFSYVISVNQILKTWANENLLIDESRVEYIPNYADLSFDNIIPSLPGEEGKRIIVLANLRPQKDHMNMLRAFKEVLDKGYKDWHLLFVGRDWEDEYSDGIKGYIKANDMNSNVSVLGGRSDTAQILKHSDIGVLSSESEGLPVALLEYALASLAVVCTDVGECAAVLDNGKVGKLVEPKNSEALYSALESYLCCTDSRQESADKFYNFVNKNYSKDSVIKNVIERYSSL